LRDLRTKTNKTQRLSSLIKDFQWLLLTLGTQLKFLEPTRPGLHRLSVLITSLLSSLFFFFLMVLGFELRAYSLSHSTSPFVVMGFFFQDRVLRIICLGWLPTVIFLMSAS
jgi:hypothetical protein